MTRDKLRDVFSRQQKEYAQLEEEDMVLIEAEHPNKFATDRERRPTLQSLIEIISEEYLEQIKDMEYSGELKVTPTTEVTRMNFYLWQLISLVEKLQALEEAVTKFSNQIRHDTTWHYNHAVKQVLAYPFVDVYLVFKDIFDSKFELRTQRVTFLTRRNRDRQAPERILSQSQTDLVQPAVEVPDQTGGVRSHDQRGFSLR